MEDKAEGWIGRETDHKGDVFSISSGQVAIDFESVVHHSDGGDWDLTDPMLVVIEHSTLLMFCLEDHLQRGGR
jgi:hypothetical protein